MVSRSSKFFQRDSGRRDNVTSESAICSGDVNSSASSPSVSDGCDPAAAAVGRAGKAVPGSGATWARWSSAMARNET